MSDCITHFYTKKTFAPKTGIDPPLKPAAIIPALKGSTRNIWALVGSSGVVSSTSSPPVRATRVSRGRYSISWSANRTDENYIISRYADNERFNNLRLSRQSLISNRTLTSFIIEWQEKNTLALVDTNFSISIY